MGYFHDDLTPRDLNLVEDLKRFQKLRGLTTKDLAAKAGISRTGLSQILNGHKSPTLATLEKICQVLGCRVIVRLNQP